MPPASPDHLDGLFRRLVENLTALDPAAVHRPVRVSEIADRLVPYKTHRVVLGFDTNEDYEMTLLRLLAGERGLAQVFPASVADAFAAEVKSVNPDPALFRQFPDATVLLDPSRLERAGNGYHETEAEARIDALPDPESEEPAAVEREAEELLADDPGGDDDIDDDEDDDEGPPLPFVLEDAGDEPRAQPRAIASSAPCPYCGAGLPVGRTVLFCPHCGQNIGVVHCPTCGSELDVGWTFCITCGQKAPGLG